MRRAIQIVKDAGGKVSFDFADSFLIDRYKDVLNSLVEHIDIAFLNEDEAELFTGHTALEAAKRLAKKIDIVAVKLGKAGSLIAANNEIIRIEPVAVTVENTNGAGDAYAGAFLSSYLQGKDLDTCGRVASYVAAQAVASVGARVQRSLADEINSL